MTAARAAWLLAAQSVLLPPDDATRRPVYLHVGLGVESRLTLAEPLVRIEGHTADKAVLGLALLQAQPHTLLRIRPREAGVARLLWVGQHHTVAVVVEASRLGRAQQIELRVAAPADDARGRADATPGGEPPASTAPVAPEPPAAAPTFSSAVPGLAAAPSMRVEQVKHSAAGWVVRLRLEAQPEHTTVRAFELDGQTVAFDTRPEAAAVVVEGRTAPAARRPRQGVLVLVVDGREHTRALTLARRGWLARLVHRDRR